MLAEEGKDRGVFTEYMMQHTTASHLWTRGRDHLLGPAIHVGLSGWFFPMQSVVWLFVNGGT